MVNIMWVFAWLAWLRVHELNMEFMIRVVGFCLACLAKGVHELNMEFMILGYPLK
jgi:hypothetical protein